MATQLTWKPDTLVSLLHAGEAASRGVALADPRLAEAVEQPAAELASHMRANQISTPRLWRHLIPLAAKLANRRQLAETVVTKIIGRVDRFEAIAAQLAAGIAGIEMAGRAALPNLAEELPLRERPLREQWEARGPGLLHQLGLVTEEQLLPEQADVLLLHPALGGAGVAHLKYNSVRLEAVLANPQAELPEVVRLGWLIGQLQLDVPVYSEHIHADRLLHIAQFAMLPAILAAAERVELARLTPETVRLAIDTWRLQTPEGVDGAALVLQWWETYSATRPPWRVALTALDQLFG
jgi:hypothetical protein